MYMFLLFYFIATNVVHFLIMSVLHRWSELNDMSCVMCVFQKAPVIIGVRGSLSNRCSPTKCFLFSALMSLAPLSMSFTNILLLSALHIPRPYQLIGPSSLHFAEQRKPFHIHGKTFAFTAWHVKPIHRLECKKVENLSAGLATTVHGRDFTVYVFVVCVLVVNWKHRAKSGTNTSNNNFLVLSAV